DEICHSLCRGKHEMTGCRPRSCTVSLFHVALAVVAFTASDARAQNIADGFTRLCTEESLTVPFTAPSRSTTNDYGGTVEVIVSGTGVSYSGLNDAFYGVPSGIPVDYQGGSYFDVPYYQLNIGWSNGFALNGCEGEPHNANNFITFIDG